MSLNKLYVFLTFVIELGVLNIRLFIKIFLFNLQLEIKAKKSTFVKTVFMSQKISLLFFGIFLLFSCAQVGRISGGDVDTFAPKPVKEKTIPKFMSTNFKGSHVEICFDEFFRLTNPVENVVIVPPHADIRTSYKGKKLFLDWKDSLDPSYRMETCSESGEYRIRTTVSMLNLTSGSRKSFIRSKTSETTSFMEPSTSGWSQFAGYMIREIGESEELVWENFPS